MENLDEKVKSFMESKNITPFFQLTPQQKQVFGASLKNPMDLYATVTSRIILGDPQVGVPTIEQKVFAEHIKNMMGI